MSAWEAGQVGNGTYSVHVEGPDYAVEARGIALAAGANTRQDLTALAARRMTVTLVATETDKPVPNVRIPGVLYRPDRLGGTTDGNGVVTFGTLPGA